MILHEVEATFATMSWLIDKAFSKRLSHPALKVRANSGKSTTVD